MSTQQDMFIRIQTGALLLLLALLMVSVYFTIFPRNNEVTTDAINNLTNVVTKQLEQSSKVLTEREFLYKEFIRSNETKLDVKDKQLDADYGSLLDKYSIKGESNDKNADVDIICVKHTDGVCIKSQHQ